jgi:hypothetical protein
MLVKTERKRKKGKPRMKWTDDVEDFRNLGVDNWKKKVHEKGMAGESF